MKIKFVPQPCNSSCGIACLSMVTGVPFQEIKSLMIANKIFDKNTDWFSTNFKDLIFTLNKLGTKTENRRKFKKWAWIPAKVAIVSTNYDRFGIYHWVVFVRDINGHFIYDPAKRRKKIRSLQGKMTGWFIEIL